MPTCCICYTTDQTYLFPTLVSAIQARRHASRDKADVIIFGFGIDPAARRDFGAVCKSEGIDLQFVDAQAIERAPMTMARLFLNRFAPEQYTRFLYMDGDVQIVGSLDELLDADVPPGHFLAANDPMTFILPDSDRESRDLTAHMRSIGLDAKQALSYFNAGILLINRTGWDRIGLQAWNLFKNRSFRFHDQDVLNIVATGNRIPMSLAWNFPIFMRNARVETDIKPRIYHFMSSPKPWHGNFPPWEPGACAPYRDTIRRYPSLAAYRRPFPFRKRVRYHLQQRYKRIVETLTWGLSERRNRILDYEKKVRLCAKPVKS